MRGGKKPLTVVGQSARSAGRVTSARRGSLRTGSSTSTRTEASAEDGSDRPHATCLSLARRVVAASGEALLHPEVHQVNRNDLGVALAEDAVTGTVLCVALPHDDEVA